MVQGAHAIDTFFKYCQMDGEVTTEICNPTTLIPVRCFIPGAFCFSFHEEAYLLAVFPNPCQVWD
jgi:hypothetical protein